MSAIKWPDRAWLCDGSTARLQQTTRTLSSGRKEFSKTVKWSVLLLWTALSFWSLFYLRRHQWKECKHIYDALSRNQDLEDGGITENGHVGGSAAGNRGAHTKNFAQGLFCESWSLDSFLLFFFLIYFLKAELLHEGEKIFRAEFILMTSEPEIHWTSRTQSNHLLHFTAATPGSWEEPPLDIYIWVHGATRLVNLFLLGSSSAQVSCTPTQVDHRACYWLEQVASCGHAVPQLN